MYILTNPPITIMLSDVKMDPKMNPTNYAYLAIWERKCLHSPKTWECVSKPKQPNKLGPAHSSRGLKQRVASEGQFLFWRKLSNTGIFPQGHIQAGTSPMMAFLCQLYGPCQSAPFTEAHRDTKNSTSHGGGVYIKIFEIAFQCTL